ncbi:SurA N-terminal domain-containing protein [Ruania halotolerans]|uniref:SurA N-terminal domain-containing protein n=1 Tax=Ruania halotolerans TaxID=2897773 RepID=UPI001E52B68F|nr:SurA N-terminal domain-containing protein [Ruania halotolerans]UFU07894.1 SurA N-terminal domain-containing protein [Ruania halotolerans]
MSITRPLIAVSVAAVVALAGCTSGSDGEGDPAETEPSASATDDTPAPEGEGGPEFPEADTDDLPDVVAVVNGEEIGRDEFLSSYEGQLQQAAMSQQTTGEEVDQDALKQQVVELLVNNRLLTQAASDAGIEPTDEDIQATLEDVAAQNGLGSADEVIAALEEQGVTEEQVRADAASQYQVSTFIESEADVEEPSEDELREQYDALVEQAEAQGEQTGDETEIPPFEEVRDQLASQATSEQQNAAVEGILADLREAGDVTINL